MFYFLVVLGKQVFETFIFFMEFNMDVHYDMRIYIQWVLVSLLLSIMFRVFYIASMESNERIRENM